MKARTTRTQEKLVRRLMGLKWPTLVIALSSAMIFPAAFVPIASAEDCVNGVKVAGRTPEPIQGAPMEPTPEQLSSNLDWLEEQRYRTMQQFNDEQTLEVMDAATAEVLPFAVGDLLYDGGLLAGGDDTVAVAQETAKRAAANDGELSSAILKTAMEIAAADLPTLRTLIYLQEKSSHRDRWDFSISVKLLDKCGQVLDEGHDFRSIADHWGKDESGLYYLDLPLKNIRLDFSGVEALNVTARPYWCHSGWYSGKNYGCGESPTSGSIQIKYI